MAHWNSRGLRGSVLEEAINFVNERYQKQGLALFQKIATPIVPVKIDPNTGTITQAYFEKHSTVDYIGIAQGVAICFDAKETANKSLPLKNIHAHQIEFMQEFQKQGGLSFILVHFTTIDRYFLLPIAQLTAYHENANCGGRKSIPLEAFDEKYEIIKKGNGVLHYLEAVQKYNESYEC